MPHPVRRLAGRFSSGWLVGRSSHERRRWTLRRWLVRVVAVPQAICPVVADTSAAVVLAVAEDTQAAAVTANAGSVS